MSVNLTQAMDVSPASPRGERLVALLKAEHSVIVRGALSQGSVTREPGNWIAVFTRKLVGAIGGGRVKYQRIKLARVHLADRVMCRRLCRRWRWRRSRGC